ncbi:hypothetical protein DPMN_039037 [Dreissena polymorpha]|uniref:Uncharacterized protein n=1 Tax=Dreissena polymorpha TaxID=45954 RepID=A0A9D4RNT6_DREPO|nr:hypothetical protein DPMN_039037 [Dreissena polymorpha]
MVTFYDNRKQFFCLFEPITALEFLLQPLVESLDYIDRQIWLAENGCHRNIVTVFDEFISPRNLALVAIKTRWTPNTNLKDTSKLIASTY